MKRTRSQINKEISALGKLADTDINTSDFPEISDWSESIAGRFYRSRQRVIEAQLYRDDQPQNSLPGHENQGYKSEQRPDDCKTGEDPITGKEITEPDWESIPDIQLIAFCSQNKEGAWQEFRSRYQHRISKITMRIALQWGYSSREVIEEIIGEININFVADAHRLSKAIPINEKPGFFYIRTVLDLIVKDYLKRRNEGNPINKLDSKSKPDIGFSLSKGHPLTEKISQTLQQIASEREQRIFWLYYGQGFTAQEIADLPEINLGPKGVQSLLLRVTREVESRLKEDHPELWPTEEMLSSSFNKPSHLHKHGKRPS